MLLKGTVKRFLISSKTAINQKNIVALSVTNEGSAKVQVEELSLVLDGDFTQYNEDFNGIYTPQDQNFTVSFIGNGIKKCRFLIWVLNCDFPDKLC